MADSYPNGQCGTACGERESAPKVPPLGHNPALKQRVFPVPRPMVAVGNEASTLPLGTNRHGQFDHPVSHDGSHALCPLRQGRQSRLIRIRPMKPVFKTTATGVKMLPF